jgi:hypothetical protein
MSRNLVQAAEQRARVVSFLNASHNCALSMASLVTAIKVETAGRKGFESLIHRMVKNGLITQRKTDEGVRYANNDFDWDPIGGGADNQGSTKPIRKTRISKMNAATSVADLTVDISKATGRIRLTTNGLTIDIGVIA